MKSRIYIALTLVFLQTSYSIAKEQEFISVENVLESKKIQLSTKDKEVSRQIANFYEQYKKGIIRTSDINSIYRSTRKNSTFRPYHIWLGNLKEISNSSKITSTRELCLKLISTNKSSMIDDYLNKQSELFCLSKYMELINSRYTKRFSLAKTEWGFISENIKLFLTDYSKESLIKMLNLMSKTTTKDYKILSRMISEHYMGNDIVPDKEVLAAIEHDANLTKFVQIKGLDENSVYSIFYNQLSELVSKGFDLVENGTEAQIDEATSHVINFYNLNQDFLPHTRTTERLVGLAKYLTRNKYVDTSRRLISNLLKYNKSDDIYFEELWTYLVVFDYKGANKVIERHNLFRRLTSLSDPQLIYWIGQTYTGLEETKRSAEVYSYLIQTYPLSFYAIVASKELQNNSSDNPIEIFNKVLSSGNSDPTLSQSLITDEFYNALKRLKLWSLIDFKNLINLERAYIFDATKEDNASADNPFTYHLLSNLFTESENYLESFKVAYKGLTNKEVDLSSKLLTHIFPRPYLNHIQSKSDDVDPMLVLSLMRQESSFNPNARSRVGALGLMQIMPATAKTLSRSISSKKLLRPQHNIKLGVKYLKKLLDKYDQNIVYALAAYNAGEGRVNNWQKRYFHYDSLMHNVESIPFSETRKYVKLILRNMFFYRLLEDQKRIEKQKHVKYVFGVDVGFKG